MSKKTTTKAKKDPFTVKKTSKPKKKVHQLYLLRRVGTGWEVSNGSVKFQGNNRSELLDTMDRWEDGAHKARRKA